MTINKSIGFAVYNSLVMSQSDIDIKFLPESDDGNVEYKLRLDTKTIFGKKKMVSQMNYRLEEGQRITNGKKEAHYLLGINDNGEFGNLTEKQIDDTYAVFNEVVKLCGSNIIHNKKQAIGDKYFMYIIIDKICKGAFVEMNVAFVGPSQHGKTTTISNLTYDQIDDGNGYARRLVHKHDHEKVLGLTTSLKKEIMGFCNNQPINYNTGMTSSWENIAEMSDKIINLIDFPGHTKYLKNILYGLSVYNIDLMFIVIDPSKLILDDFIMIDFYKKYAQEKNIRYEIINITDDVNNNDNKFSNIEDKKPIINLSNKLGHGKSQILDCLNAFEIKKQIDKPKTNNVFSIIDTYFVSESGTIYSGIVNSGSLTLNDKVYISNGIDYFESTIKSIHKKTINSETLHECESGAIQLVDRIENTSCKHLTISTSKLELYSTLFFEIISIFSPTMQNDQFILLMNNNTTQNTLFVNNNIDNINITLIDKYLLQFNYNKHLITNTNYAFIKNNYGICIGKIYS